MLHLFDGHMNQATIRCQDAPSLAPAVSVSILNDGSVGSEACAKSSHGQKNSGLALSSSKPPARFCMRFSAFSVLCPFVIITLVLCVVSQPLSSLRCNAGS